MNKQRPLFGVITTTVAHRHRSTRSRVAYQPGATWQDLEQRADELGLTTCLFRPEDLDMKRARVHGWVCSRTQGSGDQGSKVWRRVNCPLPDVVYENVFVHLSKTRVVKQVRNYFQQRQIPVFNPRLGDKAELADWLRHYPELWKHHPETVLLTSPKEVSGLLQRYPSVYLKPVLGSAGQGIIEIRQTGTGRYRVSAVKYGKDKRFFTKELTNAKVLEFVKRERKRLRYIVQAGCELLWVSDGKIDLRTHLQRNLQGEWELVGLIVKRGSPGSIVSNYHAGGSVHSWEWLKKWAENQGVGLPRRRAVIELSKEICAAYAVKHPHLASLGLDLGIDRDGKIWLLDVNARPGRNILEREQKGQCQKLNAEFAKFLCYNMEKGAEEQVDDKENGRVGANPDRRAVFGLDPDQHRHDGQR
ncbi:YheC/D-like protein [Tumebacillus sp. BK434]|uniref:YheC/YheD family endospore coat-associated protein n=1 Tax=Tumebacillus sp. BK434 TaxID=2512169 RepID=UPI001050C08D|nr:YheC/YheD family protein [Tumebacillus sp. BK434]TCP53776.1 YheC/D-like protein [Tumebacillus sp. BK434]